MLHFRKKCTRLSSQLVATPEFSKRFNFSTLPSQRSKSNFWRLSFSAVRELSRLRSINFFHLATRPLLVSSPESLSTDPLLSFWTMSEQNGFITTSSLKLGLLINATGFPKSTFITGNKRSLVQRFTQVGLRARPRGSARSSRVGRSRRRCSQLTGQFRGSHGWFRSSHGHRIVGA